MDQLKHVDLGGGGDAYYVYGTDQQRVRKVIERQNGLVVERIYLGALEIYRERQSGNAPHFERYTLTIADESGSIAQIDTKTIDTKLIDHGNAIDVPNIRYQHTNLLDSATVETDESGNVISYEEFHPFGTSSYRSAKPDVDLSLKRYRFSGKELDNETGLYYFGARYYAPWLGRWTSSDPAGMADGTNTYVYCENSPVNQTDPLGLATTEIQFEDDVITAGEGKTQVIQPGEFTGMETLSELKEIPIKEGYHFDPTVTEENLSTFYEPGPGELGSGGVWKVLLPNGSGDGTGTSTAPAPSPPPQQPVEKPSPEPGDGGGGEKKERNFFTSSFFKGLVVGVGITLAVVAVVATGGAALAVIAPAAYGAIAGSAVVSTGLAIAGGVGIAVGAAGIVQSVRQRDLWNNPISEEQANFNLGLGIGSFAGGAVAKPIAAGGAGLGQDIGKGLVGASEGLSNLVEGGGPQLALAGGGVFGGEMAVAAPATGTVATTTAAGISGTAIGATTMAMAGHTADWELQTTKGQFEKGGQVKSGRAKPPGRTLNWKEQLRVHTERKILRLVGGKVKPGQKINIWGTKPPCNPGGRGCSNAMLNFARKYGVRIDYTDVTTGMTYEYP
jgi:RHS repeat-associated protein